MPHAFTQLVDEAMHMHWQLLCMSVQDEVHCVGVFWVASTRDSSVAGKYLSLAPYKCTMAAAGPQPAAKKHKLGVLIVGSHSFAQSCVFA
jgi:hypothetical protein